MAKCRLSSENTRSLISFRKLKVCRKWEEGDPIERGPLSGKEKLIVEFFSKMENVQKMVE